MIKTFLLDSDENASKLWACLKGCWRSCAEAGKPITVQIFQDGDKRSNQANRYYWAILRHIAENLHPEGNEYSAAAWHQYYAGEFIGYVDGPHLTRVPISTTTLPAKEFSEYVEKIMADASQNGVTFE